MKVTERRTMLYLSEDLYRKSSAIARRKGKSLASVVREALARYIATPERSDYEDSLNAGFGVWRDRKIDGVRFEDRARAPWRRRAKS